MKKWMIPTSIVIIIALTTFFVITRTKEEPAPELHVVTLRVPDTRFMGILPLYIAEEKGYFADEGIDIQWIDVRDPGQAAKLFFNGQADFMMTTFANLVPAEIRKPGTLRLLYPIYESVDQPGSYILVRQDSEIKTIEDLRGRTLGTYSGPSQKAYALVVLRRLGLREPEDVRLVQVASSAQVQGLFGGSFDALFTVETHGSTAIWKGARVIEKGIRTKYISDPFWLGSAAIPVTLVENQPAAIALLLNALERATSFIIEHELEAREILARRTGTADPVANQCALYTWVAYPTKRDLQQIQEHIELLVAEQFINKSVIVTDLFEGALDD